MIQDKTLLVLLVGCSRVVEKLIPDITVMCSTRLALLGQNKLCDMSKKLFSVL